MTVIGSRLEAFLRAHVDGEPPEISGLARLGVGRSRENWVFDARWPDGRLEHLILRQDPRGGLVDTDRAVEFAALRALEGSGLGAPRARWLDADGTWMERPALVMVREPGVCDYALLSSDRPLETRVALARKLCELMAAVHDLDWRACGLGAALGEPGSCPARTELQRWEAILRADQLEAYPELELVLLQLAETAPACPSVTLVHADFKPGNVLVQDDQVGALLDWELVHLGDPLEDLGWVTQPLRTREHLIPGAWEREDLIAHYARLRPDVDPSALAWWNLFAGFKTAVMQVSGLRSFVEGRSDDLYKPSRKVLRTLLSTLAEAGDRVAAHHG